jgi:hypothetical protein
VEVERNVIPFPVERRRRPLSDAADLRFRRLVGEEGWAELPEAVRTRFGKRLGGGRTVIYAGETIECRMTRAGRLLALAARLIGGPLPISRDVFLPACVSVTEEPDSGGQFWTRIYGRAHGFPQVIHSSKRFAGPTGLEEYVGRGVGVALSVSVEGGALHFDSDHYFLEVGRVRLRLPRWMAPGQLRVSHVDCTDGWFAFVLVLSHRWGGELIRQTAMFRERVGPAGEEDR